MTMITFANVFAVLASIAGILANLVKIPVWINVTCLTILLFISLIPLVSSLITFLRLKTSRWMCLKLDIYSYILGSTFEGWLAQRMVEGKAICCNNNLKEPQTILFDEYFTFSRSRHDYFLKKTPVSLNYTCAFQYMCYHQPLAEPETDGFTTPGGTFSELERSEHDLDGVMKLVEIERVCIYFQTGEITQRISYDRDTQLCSVANFIYTHSKKHIVGQFVIKDLKRIKQLFYMKGIESDYPKLKVAKFVKMRRGVMVMHYSGDVAFYNQLRVKDIVRVKLDKCETLSYEGVW
ncbi:hypothetical protein M758_9G022500 [Ceratodon purpureus]|nr:hypothetical protein M758_9G022500 [Ceratodon purpureus]